MFNLVYRSRASAHFGQTQILEMLEQARNFNKKSNVTGCLLYFQGEFLQYLEGDQVKVLRLFDQIKADDRHSQVELLSHSYIYAREFGDWEMAYENFMGSNHQLQYLKLLVESYLENPDRALNPNPTSKSFWIAARQLLKSKSPHQM